ncbi:RmlC-like cupin, partial [Choiromyces venosus 120613-1]
YPYGRKGRKSLAAQYAEATPENAFDIKEDQPYGEIWMGDDPNGPSSTVKDNTPLGDLIANNPGGYLTSAVCERFGKDKHLPFLFKILSFEKALPLRAHPDRKLAEQVKGQNETFVDPNHKPEVAVTVSGLFEGFVGFRPITEIKSFLKEVPELRDAIGNEADINAFLAVGDLSRQQELMKKLFWDIFPRPHDDVAHACRALLARLHGLGEAALGNLDGVQNLGSVAKKDALRIPGGCRHVCCCILYELRPAEKGGGDCGTCGLHPCVSGGRCD